MHCTRHRPGGVNFAADSAHGDPHSDSEAIRAGGETYCLKQIGSYQTVVMATEFSRRWPIGSEAHVSLLEAAKTCVTMQLLPEAIDHMKTVGHAA